MKRVVRSTAVAMTFAVIGLFASILSIGIRSTAPAPHVIGAPPADLSGAETVSIPSPSGSVLKGWWVPATSAGGASIVLLPGFSSDRRSMLDRARVLHAHGYAVLLFDFQATGESPGKHVTFVYLEALDATAAVAFAREHQAGGKVGVIGFSSGAAAVLLGPDPLRVNAIVLESIFPSVDAVLSHRLRIALGRIAGPVLGPPLTWAFEQLMPWIIGVSPHELRPIDRVGGVTAPILILSGADDALTTAEEARAIFEQAPGPKQFQVFPGVAHADLESVDPAAYWCVVLPFLSRYLHGTAIAEP